MIEGSISCLEDLYIGYLEVDNYLWPESNNHPHNSIVVNYGTHALVTDSGSPSRFCPDS